MILTLEEYLCGLSEELKRNAELTVMKANALLERAFKEGLPSYNPLTTSTWRPAKYNHLIQGSSKFSKHTSCQAVDLYDPDGLMGMWLKRCPEILHDLDIWIESPDKTPRWLHLQTTGPLSGKRIFQP
jgi:hypothetical protein